MSWLLVCEMGGKSRKKIWAGKRMLTNKKLMEGKSDDEEFKMGGLELE